MMENKANSPRPPANARDGSDSPTIKDNKHNVDADSVVESTLSQGSPKVVVVQGSAVEDKGEIGEDMVDENKDDSKNKEETENKDEPESKSELENVDLPKNRDEGDGHEGVDDSPQHGDAIMEVVEYSLDKAFKEIDRFLSTEHGEDSTVLALPDFLDKFLDRLEVMLNKYTSESEAGKVKWGANADEDSLFLESVHRLSRIAETLDPSKLVEESGASINRMESVRLHAMSFLEDEFRLSLNECKHVESDTADNEEKTQSESGDTADNEVDSQGFPPNVVSSMKSVADELMFGGFETECCLVYIIGRKNYFDELLSRLGFEILSIDKVQKMQWEAMEREIPKWVRMYGDCAKVHFLLELQFVESVFASHKPIAHRLFDNLTHIVLIHVLNFVEAVSMISKRSAEKVFKFLDVYEALRETLPAIDELFKDFEETHDIKTEITIAKSRIGEAILLMFSDLENSIKSDTSKNIVPGGAVHPLTRYTMNYLEYACEYKATLEHIFKEHVKIERADSDNRSEYNHRPPLPKQSSSQEAQSTFLAQLLRVMELLDSNIEAKSKLYKDIPLCSIFMMNNGRYILQKVKGSSGIKELIGEVWIRKKSSDLRQYHQNYKRETWGKVLGCFMDEGLTVNGKVVKPELKERFKSFNALFGEIHRTQSSWVVNDEQIQSELRVSISSVIVPAYRSFLGRFSQVFTAGRQTEKYVKYQPEDLENYIDELFDGNAGKRKS
ncbi:hypothetical protein MLD38_000101 [Melastoma candidum]|uniref:Uncharacterized protein n=1 Tax=Melastoma candidum TaxID=119954 RepID=A0ACB9S8R6_9MYRT|nr:hypothetical protein MLD38_000101 [Melastoma candidum]